MNEHPETVLMENAANYRLGKGELKPGKACLTNERFYVVEIGMSLVTTGMLAGIVFAMAAAVSIFGLAAESYAGVALKGSLAGIAGAAGGVAGAWLGGWTERKFPQKPGVTVFSARLEDIVSVGDGRLGMRRTLEIASRSGEICTMILARREKWKSALSRQTDGA